MDAEYEYISKHLDNENINYWLDHGSLLGIIRDGKFLDSDGDLDISIWEADVSGLNRVVKKIKEEGYQVTRYSYDGTEFKITIINNSTNSGPIDIDVYRRAGSFAWRPAIRLSSFAGSGDSYMEKIKLTPRWVLSVIWREILTGYKRETGILNKDDLEIKIDTLPCSLFATIGTWKIPAEIFEEIIEHRESRKPVPKAYDDYLTYRYGHWRSPDPEWTTWNNDGGLIHKKPESVVEEIT